MISFVEVFLLAAIFGVLYAMLQLTSRWGGWAGWVTRLVKWRPECGSNWLPVEV